MTHGAMANVANGVAWVGITTAWHTSNTAVSPRLRQEFSLQSSFRYRAQWMRHHPASWQDGKQALPVPVVNVHGAWWWKAVHSAVQHQLSLKLARIATPHLR